jgi:DNA topoisomerase VI subunit B
MHKELGAEFYAATTRKPAIYRGNPFQIEVGLAWGGRLEADSIARVIRFANRVPLQYQLSACSSTKAVMDVGWKSYGLQQSKGSLPTGPLVIMVHMASVWVPFTNQAKEAIADYDEIRKEFKLALQEAGRKLGAYLKKKQAAASQAKRRSVFNAYIEEVVKAFQSITKEDGDSLRQALLETARKKTELAEKLEAMKHKDPPEEMEGTLVIGPDGVPLVPGSGRGHGQGSGRRFRTGDPRLGAGGRRRPRQRGGPRRPGARQSRDGIRHGQAEVAQGRPDRGGREDPEPLWGG